MKKTLLIKALAAVLVLIGCIVAVPVNAEINRKVNVRGANGRVLQSYNASVVEYFEFVEGERAYPYAELASGNKNNIVFHLSKDVQFKMIKVQGGTYALQGVTGWTTAEKTRTLSDYYIAEFECTQGVWKAVMGSVPSGQSATGDNMPVANVSWDMLMGYYMNDTFLKRINAMMPDILANSYADVVAVIGSREFRLPNEWEWEYAAAGGPSWNSLKYTYAGTTGTSNDDLNKVAVNGVVSPTPTSVAAVGSKQSNNLGLYDMSGNVYEWCSGLGYSGHEGVPGYNNSTDEWNSSSRPLRGGSWWHSNVNYFLVSYRYYGYSTGMGISMGFRVAL